MNRLNRVYKHHHADGSETVIKQVRPASRDADGDLVERSNYVTSIFISSSAGCPKKCTFCQLTEYGVPFKKLDEVAIAKNVHEAIKAFGTIDESTKLKLCWMGMGDPFVNIGNTIAVTLYLVSKFNVTEVDISTVMPKLADIERINELLVPNVTTRLFYSLHTGLQYKRNLIVPNTISIESASIALDVFKGPVFIHYVPLKGVNDKNQDVKSIAEFIGDRNFSVRMLEYNASEASFYTRSPKLQKLYKSLLKRGVDVKWQVSRGYEATSACGQFSK